MTKKPPNWIKQNKTKQITHTHILQINQLIFVCFCFCFGGKLMFARHTTMVSWKSSCFEYKYRLLFIIWHQNTNRDHNSNTTEFLPRPKEPIDETQTFQPWKFLWVNLRIFQRFEMGKFCDLSVVCVRNKCNWEWIKYRSQVEHERIYCWILLKFDFHAFHLQ